MTEERDPNAHERHSISMLNRMWDGLTELANRNGRNASDEVRVACAMWLKMSGVDVGEDAHVISGWASRVMKRED